MLDHPVYDGEGNKIGDATHIFFDVITGEPEWVTVKTGLFGSSESFIPIHDATVVEDHLEVPYHRDEVKEAPRVDIDARGSLSEEEERRLFEYYGMDWDTAWQQEQSRTGRTARSEEEMRVGVERREVGRARLRKYVASEEQQRTVPVRREEVRVEPEPITDANRGDAMADPDLVETEHEVILHEEAPVVETSTVPKERVRSTTDEETVTSEVRKKRKAEEQNDERDKRRRP
ncbi:PRC and DUF2382 domain-containing protein [Streptomyces griseoincarnatus]